MKIVCDIFYYYFGDNYQCFGQGVGKKVDLCEFDVVVVSYVWF